MSALGFKFPLLLGVVAAGLTAVAAVAPSTSASDKPAVKPSMEAAAEVEARQATLQSMVAEQDAAARRAIENARRLTGQKQENASASAVSAVTVADQKTAAPPAGGELLRSAEDTAAGGDTGPDTELPAVRRVRMLVTAYCPCTRCCGPNAQGITASGKRVSYNGGRFVAADKTVLPFGTKLKIPGYHDEIQVEVTDTGGAIKGNRLDVYYPSHERALEWGKQWLDVVVVE